MMMTKSRGREIDGRERDGQGQEKKENGRSRNKILSTVGSIVGCSPLSDPNNQNIS